MYRIVIFLSLFSLYLVYSLLVYTKGTELEIKTNSESKTIQDGKMLFQQYNCISCHQVYGLGGYLGPELTNSFSDSLRGPVYIKAFLKNGGNGMPNFKLADNEIESLLKYLQNIDQSTIKFQ